LARFQIVENLVNKLPAKNVNAEKIIYIAKNTILGKVGREGAKILTIARFDLFKGYIEERNRIINKLC